MNESQIIEAQATFETTRHLYVGLGKAQAELLMHICESIGIEPAGLESRAKDVASLKKKLTDHPDYKSLEDVTDLCGVRAILFYLGDVEVLTNVLTQEFEVVEVVRHGQGRADSFGYQSLHLIVKLKEPRVSLPEWAGYRDLRTEIQVRTLLQHTWAAISHQLAYKNVSSVPLDARRKLFRVSALLETGDELFDAFRQEVTEPRSSYERESRTEAWRSLPCDYESLHASWSNFDWSRIHQIGLGAGFEPHEYPIIELGEDDLDEEETEISDLVEAATACGLDRLGDLARFTEVTLPSVAGRLAEFAKRSEALGWRPTAITPRVVLFSILLRNPDQSELLERLSYIDAVVEAMRSMANEGT